MIIVRCSEDSLATVHTAHRSSIDSDLSELLCAVCTVANESLPRSMHPYEACMHA